MTSWATRQADEARAARLAYRTLLATGCQGLPVDVLGILGRCKNTRLMTYTQAGLIQGQSVYGMVGALPSAQACTIKYEFRGIRAYMVLYNDDVCFGNHGSRRWSLAHELGHIVLNHGADDGAAEREANCFAQHLLCPRPLLEALPAADAALIGVAFGVSRAAASIAARACGKPCPLVDAAMAQQVRALYGIGDAATWQDVLHPAQRVAYQVRMRKG